LVDIPRLDSYQVRTRSRLAFVGEFHKFDFLKKCLGRLPFCSRLSAFKTVVCGFSAFWIFFRLLPPFFWPLRDLEVLVVVWNAIHPDELFPVNYFA